MAEFTKGPWTIQNNGSGPCSRVINGPEFDEIAYMRGSKNWPLQEANARLIAAAPELYEACMAMAKAWNEYGFGSHKQFEEMEESAHRAVLAINKADGKPEAGE